MPRVLVVEDEAALAETIAYNLKAEGFKPSIAMDGQAALVRVKEDKPDVIILDVMLPSIDGIEVCRRIRRDSDVPILMLTAKSRELDKVVGLEVGADDYITKPFGMLELIARVRAVLRRSQQGTTEPEALNAHGISMDLERHRVFVDGVEVSLRPKEFELLHCLMANRGRVMKRSVLLDRVWGEDEFIDARTVDVHVRRVREKIEKEPAEPTRLLTVRGIGYKFAE